MNECWFAPNILGKNECLSLHSAVAVAVSRAPAAMRSSLLSNIMLAGGPALTPGLKERLEAEVRKILPERLSSSVHVRCSPMQSTNLGLELQFGQTSLVITE